MAPDPTGGLELDRFQQFAAKYVTPLPVTAPLPDSFGPWVSIAIAATKVGLALGQVIGGDAIVNLLLAVTRIGDSQGSLLASIKKDTTLLRQEALKTAMTLIGEAQRVGPGDGRFKGFIEDAIRNLFRAHSLASSLEEQAVVQFCIACCYLTLNSPSDARSWVNRSVDSERAVLNALLKKRLGIDLLEGTMEIIDLRANRPTTGATGWWNKDLMLGLRGLGQAVTEGASLGTLPAARAMADLRTRRQRLERLAQFLDFANTVEVTAGETSGRTIRVVLRLEARKVHDNKGLYSHYNYQWFLTEAPFDRNRLIQ